MQTEQKNEIADRAKQYISEHRLSAADLSKQTKVNQSYLSNILNGVFTAEAGDDKRVEIKDTYFIRIAEAIGMTVKKSYWGWVQTREFMELVSQMEEAKKMTVTKTLICNTGKGKTYAVKKFRSNFPGCTYLITINSMMKLGDIINDLLCQLGLPEKGSRATRMRSVIEKFRDMGRNGGKPLLFLDEGENMTNETMRMMKALYDGICEDNYAAIVLMGTGQLLKKMEGNRRRDKEAAPQFYRRFKAGIRLIKELPVEKSFVPFFEKFGVSDKGLRRLLCELCDNYGELNAYLEPALREADEKGMELTEEFFRVKYDLPQTPKGAYS